MKREKRERVSEEREEGRARGVDAPRTLAYTNPVQYNTSTIVTCGKLHFTSLTLDQCTFLFFLCFRLGLQSRLSLLALPFLQL